MSYINREALLAEYDREHKGPPGRARELIVNAPAADVRENKRGRWKDGDMPIYGGYKCSACGKNTVHYKANYCPNCGADMREEQT